MSLMEQMDRLEKRIKNLEDTVGIIKLGLDDPNYPAVNLVKDNNLYKVGAYHNLNKKKAIQHWLAESNDSDEGHYYWTQDANSNEIANVPKEKAENLAKNPPTGLAKAWRTIVIQVMAEDKALEIADGDNDEEIYGFIIGAYHTLSKKKQCKWYYAGPELGWSSDREEAEQYTVRTRAAEELKKIGKTPSHVKPPKNFHPTILEL